MTRRDYAITLGHMRDHAREAIELVRGRSQGDLEHDRVLSLALTRLVEIVGEAAGRVPSNERRKYPGIDWARIIGMRNRLIHEYGTVDLAVLWLTVKEDFPDLVTRIEKILHA